MSEREKLENARRKGRRAAQKLEPITGNPMRAADSRFEWEDAYKEEKVKIDAVTALINKKLRGERPSCR